MSAFAATSEAAVKGRLIPFGTRYGKREVVGYLYSHPGSQAKYICRCDCGSVAFMMKQRLVRARACSHCDLEQRIRGRASVRRLPPGQAAFNSIFSAYRKGARERGFVFELSRERFASLTKMDCRYCGCQPSRTRRTKTIFGTQYADTYQFNGVDRMDSTLGYIEGNVVPCCRRCNVMKGTMGFDDFFAHVAKIAARRSL